MSELAPLISDLALILICAGIMTLIFKRLRQPLVFGLYCSRVFGKPAYALYTISNRYGKYSYLV